MPGKCRGATGRQDGPGTSRSPESLWRDGSFRLLFAGNTISAVGSQITRVVLPILVYQLTGSALQTSLLFALQTLPYLVFGLVAGAVADRFDRRVMIVACDLLRAILLGAIPVLDALGVLTATHVYILALLSAIAWVWSDAADFGAFPAIVGRRRILEASTIMNTTWTIAGMVALPLGGLLAATIGPATTITLDAISFVAAAIAVACIPRSFGTPAPAGRRRERLLRRTARDIGEGLRYLRRHELIAPLTLLSFFSSVTSGAILGLLVVYGVRQLGLGDDDARLGWLYGAATAGALLSSIALPRLTRYISQPRISLLGYATSFVLLLGVASSSSLVVSLLLLFASQAALSLTVLNSIALRQQLTPDRLQGRVNATGRMLAAGGQPVGAALGGLIAEAASIRAAFLVMAGGVGISAIIGWLTPLRRATAQTVTRLMSDADADAPAPEALLASARGLLHDDRPR